MIYNLINFKTFKIRLENFSANQKKFLPMIDPRFFPNNINIYRKKNKEYSYSTPIQLDEEVFHLHPLLDPAVLEIGSVRRFSSGINKKYIWEKYFEDKWVSEGNHALAQAMTEYIKKNLSVLKRKKVIKILDIGPCGGAITTLFALKPLADFGLLNKVEINLLDIAPSVLVVTFLGKFVVPNSLIKEYGLNFAGDEGTNYKRLLRLGTLVGVKEWYKEHQEAYPADAKTALDLSARNKQSKIFYYRGDGESLPSGVRNCDFVLSAYLHHHMNFLGRKKACEQIEEATVKGGFIGVIDFYLKDFAQYNKWYVTHFLNHGDAPPVEYPLLPGEFLQSFLKQTKIINIDNNRLENSYLLTGIKR